MIDYHPQQSVLKPQDGQRHTACMRNIGVRQRSQRTGASQAVASGAEGARRMGTGRAAVGSSSRALMAEL